MSSPRIAVGTFAVALLTLTGLLVWLGWLDRGAVFELAGLLIAVIAVSALGPQVARARDLDTMRPAFVVELATVVLHGPTAALLAAASGEIATELAQEEGRRRWRSLVVSVATSLVAVQSASAAHAALGGEVRVFDWPQTLVPIAAAVVSYWAVRALVAGVIVPLAARQSPGAAWPRVVGAFPTYVVGVSLAVGLAEALMRQQWTLLLVTALPLVVVHRAYGRGLDRQHEDRHRRAVIDALQGMCVVNERGEVTLWSEALERLVGCPRARALGQGLAQAVPSLARSEVMRTLDDVLAGGTAKAVSRVSIPTVAAPRTLDVRVLPVDGGATLLWQDVTERVREDGALKRTEARMALAAEAANDGLWEWDLRNQECYFSGPWRAQLGLPARAGGGRPADWLDRVHAEDVQALKDAVKAHLTGATDRLQHEHRIRHEDGSYRWFICRGVAMRDVHGRPIRLAGSLTERVDGVVRDRLGSAGFLDPLTGLANRTVFVERLGRRLVEAKARPGGDPFAVLYLDLDRFKVVNDSLGHMVGDELLTAASRRLESCLRPTDVLARLGGDEFAILLNNLGDEQQANAVAFRIQESLSAPFSIGGREVFTTASIGIAIGLTDYNSPDEIMRDADTAMYHAKTRGKARHELFDADMHARVRDRLGLENDLRHAVANNSFEVHYQPIVALGSGMCVGFESLLRWTRNGQPIPPDKFIPLAEELGLIESVGTWVLRQACHTFADWQRRYPGSLDYVTVNVSSRQLVQQNFLSVVERAVHDAGLRPSDLRLEITETALMDSPKTAASLLRELRDFGVKIYLDDFGTGFSSLSHLHRLPVDALKIDRSFVNSLLLPERPAIVESILALARTLNTSVVAEGIETDAQALELERLGCTHAQGYLFSRPLAPQAAEELLARNRPLGPKGLKPHHADHDALPASGPFAWPEFIPVGRESINPRASGLAGA